MKNPLLEIVRKQKQKEAVGIFSVCTANPLVIEATIRFAKKNDIYVLLEATANQVNQEGGYTGMKADNYRDFVYEIADKNGLSREKIILGGDHLGPLTWTNEDDEVAMQKAEDLIGSYIAAGFTKLHIDASMRLKSDSLSEALSNEKIVMRTIRLAKAAKIAFEARKILVPNAVHPVFVIGSEVPIPGGSFDDDEIHITTTKDLKESLNEYEGEFIKNKLDDIWENIVAVVVQPGVEFGNHDIHEYSRENAAFLSKMIRNYNKIVFEGHSTDYQTKEHLREMVEDGIAILKVGPGLTFALREVLYLLELCELELIEVSQRSKFKAELDAAMLENEQYWKKYYSDDDLNEDFQRKYSYSDRCRYYLNTGRVETAINKLFCNFDNLELPLPLVSNYFPNQYQKIRNRVLSNTAESIMFDYLFGVLDDYLFATQQQLL